MKTNNGSKVFFLVTVWCALAAASGAAAATRIIVADVGFATPESVEYDAAGDVYLVTNINGDPLAKDGNGFVSKLKPDGSIVELKWIDGTKPGVTLNAPKGAAIVGKHLLITDIDQIQVFSLPSGQPLRSITIRGSTFLNGITPGDGDFVYVTDSGLGAESTATKTDAVYKVWVDGRYQLIVADPDMGRPNGIWDDGEQLWVVTFGSGEMFTIDRAGAVAALPAPPAGALDGLVKLDDGLWVMSSWGGSALYSYGEAGYAKLAGDLDAPADLGVDTRRKRLLIPLFKKDQVVILPY